MPLPEALKPLLTTRRFWTDFFFNTAAEEDSYADLEETVTIEFPVSSKADVPSLVFQLSNDLSSYDLSLKAGRGSKTYQLGWDDQAHWHPHVLRWEELDLVCRAVARLEPDLPHPGLPLLLLYRFAPICGQRGGEDDDAEFASSLLDAAWRRLGLFSDREIRRLIEKYDARDAGFRWHRGREEGTWEIKQLQDVVGDSDDFSSGRGLYSLRSGPSDDFEIGDDVKREGDGEASEEEEEESEEEDSEDDESSGPFPHHELNTMLDAARDTVLQTTQGVPVSDGILPSERPHKPYYTLRSQYSLMLRLPLLDGPRPLERGVRARVINPLNRILTDLNIGWAQLTSSSSSRRDDGTFITRENSLSVRIDGDRERGLQVIRETLQWAGVPETTVLRGNGYKEVPLNINESDSSTGEMYLQLARHLPTSEEERPTLFHMTFTRACVDALHSDPDATIKDPHADGWLAVTPRGDSEASVHNPDLDGWLTVSAPDGGEMGVCFTPREDEEDLITGSLAIRKLSPSLAGIIHRLLSSQGLALFPPGLVTSELSREMEAETTVVQSATKLHEVLASGSYAWWSRPLDRS